MPRVCTVCTHKDIEEINHELALGQPRLRVAKKYGLSEPAVRRHANAHLPMDIVASVSRPIPVEGILTEMRGLLDRANEVEMEAKDDEKPVLQLRAIREQSRIIESLIKLAGILAERATAREALEVQRSIAQSVEWIALRTAIIAALHPYPEARQAVMVALGGQYAITSG